MNLKYILTIFIIVLAGSAIYIFIFPNYTTLSPKIYFSNNISSINLNQFELFTMQETPSMLPTIPYGATVIVLPISQSQNISVGDIIAFNFQNNKYPIAHRVIQISNNKYLTKGDNNKLSDSWINQSQIIGKVVGVLY